MIDFEEFLPNYEFYTGTYKGTILSQPSFEFYIGQANQIVWEHIHMNAFILEDEISEDYEAIVKKIKFAQCAIADLEAKYGSSANENVKKDVVSESAGKVSVQYADISSNVTKSFARYQNNIIKRYLADTGLLYKGVG